MAENTLRVDPDVVTNGAQRIRSLEENLREILTRARTAQGPPAGTLVRRCSRHR
jgi:hypothetical protein